MPTWLRYLLAFATFCGGVYLFVFLAVSFFNVLMWNHIPSKEEKAKVRELKKEKAKLQKANQRKEAEAISSKIVAIQRSGKDNPNRERVISGFLCLLGAAYVSLWFATTFLFIGPKTSYVENLTSSFNIFGWPLVLAAVFCWLNLFPKKNGDSSRVVYAIIIYAGTVLGKSFLAKQIFAKDGILYLISGAFSVLICVVHWLIHKDDAKEGPNNDGFKLDNKDKQYIDYIIKNSYGKIEYSEAEAMMKALHFGQKKGKDAALAEFDKLANEIIRKSGGKESPSALYKISYLAGLFYPNGVLSKEETDRLAQKYLF